MTARKPAEGSAAEEAAESPAFEKTEDEKTEPYGNVTYADPGYQPDGKKRYPLDTEAHARAAASYFGRQSNRDRYTRSQQQHIDKAIAAAEKKFGVDPGSYKQVIDQHS